MLLRLRQPLDPSERKAIFATAKELGYSTQALEGREDLLVLEGHGGPDHRTRLGDLSGVAAILDGGDARELVLRPPEGPDVVVEVGQARFGGGELSLIAGPCAVEDEDRLIEIAHAVRRAGACALRGGAFKPRTSPYSFQGLGQAGLEILDRVKDETGLAVVTEVLDTRDVELVARTADMLQIGARSMQNFPLLREVGRIAKPVLLKRSFAATVGEFLGAAEYILAEGNDQVVLCERGIRSFDSFTRNVLDVGAIAHLKQVTHLPVIADPSHAAGRSDLVRAMARAGLVSGADGLLVEVHTAPSTARCDGAQAVSAEHFAQIARDAGALAAIDGRQLVTDIPTGSLA